MKRKRTTQFMRVTQAAFRLGIDPRWLQAEAAAGRIPALNCAGVFMVNCEAVRAVLAERAAQTKGAKP